MESYKKSHTLPNKAAYDRFCDTSLSQNRHFSIFLGHPKTLEVWFIIKQASVKFYSLPETW